MKKLLYTSIGFAFIIAAGVINIGVVKDRIADKTLHREHSHIIGTTLNLDFSNHTISGYSQYLLCTISLDCQSCFIKLNNLSDLHKNDRRFIGKQMIVLVAGDNDQNKRIDELKRMYGFEFIQVSYDEIDKVNRYFSVNQTYILDQNNEVLLAGDMFENRSIINVFAKYLNEK